MVNETVEEASSRTTLSSDDLKASKPPKYELPVLL
ncbi:hypothetical protein OROGR_019951 [Orobanche gracilis]